ncbi:hypothetical protein GXP76_22910 [Streptomyces sp. NP-1717]|nr:hypothetical protein [Streptomyces sp. NP-1717]
MDRAHHVEDVHLASGASLEPIAGDDTGGTYFLCGGTAVLHASSEGDAVLIADSVSEALEMLIRLPWYCENISGDLDEEQLRAAVEAGDAEAREEFAPELDAHRAALLAGLGLPDRPLTELAALMEAAVDRTEPDHLLLNSTELCAYRLTDESRRRPLRDVVLGPGRAVLARVRAGEPGAYDEALADPVLRAGVIRAARYDRRDGDLPLLRLLLERETSERTEGARDWARAMDADSCGRDPEAESEFTWIELARAQGRIEHARVALIRLLDDAGPADAELLGRLSASLERLGDHAQAARAQFFFLSLQDTDRDRAVAACDLARLERRKGDLAAARRALERARTAVRTVPQWHRHGLGRLITEQHLELALAAAEAGDAPLARETMALGRELLSTIARQHAKALSELSTRAKWAVAALGRDQG